MIDTSASTAGKLKFQQESAMNFIQTVVKPRKDRVLYGTFDDEVKFGQDFTDKWISIGFEQSTQQANRERILHSTTRCGSFVMRR
jgi:hypothetical protein